jgi:hypothetical protein
MVMKVNMPDAELIVLLSVLRALCVDALALSWEDFSELLVPFYGDAIKWTQRMRQVAV